MDLDEFWAVIESARAATAPAAGAVAGDGGRAIADALVAALVPLGTEAVLGFADHFQSVTSAIHRWDVWAAAYLIANGCSDDGFQDFKAGVVVCGRDWHRQVVADPDGLADHPGIVRAADGGDPRVIFAEVVGYVPSYAFERITGDDHACWDLLEVPPRSERREPADMGEAFPFNDDEFARRLPRLTAMFRPGAAP